LNTNTCTFSGSLGLIGVMLPFTIAFTPLTAASQKSL
jgi:hypothetical protein